MLLRPPKPIQSSPATEPVTIHEMKRHLNISMTDTSQDAKLLQKIKSAREQFERDTGRCFIKRDVTLTIDRPRYVEFSLNPVSSITYVKYYDTGNALQTLSSSVYQLDSGNNSLRLAYMQQWPAYSARWDAVAIAFVAGEHDDSTTVPGYAKSAIMLLAAREFEDPDMMAFHNNSAYEHMVHKYMRASYP